LFHGSQHRLTEFGRRVGHDDASFLECCDLVVGSSLTTRDDGTSMSCLLCVKDKNKIKRISNKKKKKEKESSDRNTYPYDGQEGQSSPQ